MEVANAAAGTATANPTPATAAAQTAPGCYASGLHHIKYIG